MTKQAWRDVMDNLSASSCDYYRAYVRDNEDFVSYFREATPEQELAKLPLGSRPARRITPGLGSRGTRGANPSSAAAIAAMCSGVVDGEWMKA